MTGQVSAALGSGLKAGATAALAAIGGFAAGKAEGASGGSGLTSAVTAGLTAGVVTGNPVIGALAAGAALLGAEIGRASQAAQVFKERMQGIADAVRGGLESALRSGKDAVLDFKNAFTGSTSSDDLKNSITDLLAPETLSALTAAGLEVSDLFAAFRKGQPGVTAFINSIGGNQWDGNVLDGLSEAQAAGVDLIVSEGVSHSAVGASLKE